MDLKLFTYFRSSASYRLRIALNLKGLDFESAFVNLRNGEQSEDAFLSQNPQGLVPALEHQGIVLNQSIAILEYLEEQFPQPPLLPEKTMDRAQVRALTQTIACEIHPLNNLRVLKYLRSPLQHNEEEVNTWYQHWIAVGFQALEGSLSEEVQHFCFGEQATFADVCLLPQVYNAKRFKCDLAPYPKINRIVEHLETIPAFAQALPEHQPDAPQ